MSPKRRVKAPVYFLNRAIFFLQPYPECFFTVLTIAFPAKFIGNMPCRDILIILVPLCQHSCQLRRILPVRRAVRAGVVPSAEFVLPSMLVRAQNIRVPLCHPGRMRAGRSSQTYFQAVCTYQFHNRIQLFKLIRILIRL